jgi:hypothetical protein
MKSTPIFFILLLIGSPLGVTQINSVESEKNIEIFEEIVLGTNTQKNGFFDKVIKIDESLILKNIEKFTKNTNSNQFLQERITISERTSPSTRLRNNIDSEIFGSKRKYQFQTISKSSRIIFMTVIHKHPSYQKLQTD